MEGFAAHLKLLLGTTLQSMKGNQATLEAEITKLAAELKQLQEEKGKNCGVNFFHKNLAGKKSDCDKLIAAANRMGDKLKELKQKEESLMGTFGQLQLLTGLNTFMAYHATPSFEKIMEQMIPAFDKIEMSPENAMPEAREKMADNLKKINENANKTMATAGDVESTLELLMSQVVNRQRSQQKLLQQLYFL